MPMAWMEGFEADRPNAFDPGLCCLNQTQPTCGIGFNKEPTTIAHMRNGPPPLKRADNGAHNAGPFPPQGDTGCGRSLRALRAKASLLGGLTASLLHRLLVRPYGLPSIVRYGTVGGYQDRPQGRVAR